MATGGKDESEDSGYITVRGVSKTKVRKSVGNVNEETTELKAIKTMNKNLNEKITTLKQKIQDQKIEFGAEKMDMIRRHKRETENLKKIHEKTVERLNTKTRENEKHIEEIKMLKATIESLEKTEEELREKLKNARKDKKYRDEYEKQMRNVSASKEEIRKLKEQVVKLENTVAEKDKEIIDAINKNVDLSTELGDLAKKHEDDMDAMKNDLFDKMDEKEKNSIEMFKNLERLIIQRTQGQSSDAVMSPQFEQNRTPLPPISSRSPSNTNTTSGTKPSWKPW